MAHKQVPSLAAHLFPLSPADLLRRAGVCSVTCPVCLFATPWTVARQDPLSTGFSRKEYWSGLPFPLPGDLPDPGIKQTLVSCIAGRFFTTEPPLQRGRRGDVKHQLSKGGVQGSLYQLLTGRIGKMGHFPEPQFFHSKTGHSWVTGRRQPGCLE